MIRAPSPAAPGRLSVDVAVCTFRRAMLAQTLDSLARLAVPDSTSVRVIVADNDVEPSARSLVATAAETMPFPIEYVHCPARNISIARNACLDACRGDFLAFIDDDETATPGWLVGLLAAAEASAADVVLGPVRALYDGAAPGWMRRGDFHSTRPVWVDGEIMTGYTCNALLRMRAAGVQGCRFNVALGRSGGEDTEFFSHVHRSGGRIVFSPEALVEEPVPAGRARLAWLAKRRFRSGQTHARLLKEQGGQLATPRNIELAMSKAGFCAGMAVMCLFSRRRSVAYFLRGMLHAGVVGGLLGLDEIRQYGGVGVET